MPPKEIVLKFWQAMQSNDFSQVGDWLSDDFICEWQQTNERIVGRENFIAINSAYPTDDQWQFIINRIVVDDNYLKNQDTAQVVTEVDVTDGKVNARAITFHTIKNGKITHQIEYWLDDFKIGMYDAHEWRKQWIELIKTNSLEKNNF